MKKVECCGALFSPVEDDILLRQVDKRASDSRVIGDKGAVELEVAEAKERTYFCEILWDRPIKDSFNFCRVHCNFTVSDDHS
jgi:hypothetical protein